MKKPNRFVWIYPSLLLASILPALAPITNAQGAPSAPIRVESNQVLVPVLVLNKLQEESLLQRDRGAPSRDIGADELQAWRDIWISGLLAADFDVFEDGHEQTIQNVSLEGPFISDVKDSVGKHYEYVGAGGGRWAYSDVPQDGNMHVAVSWPNYLLAYIPPRSPNGSCHKVTVKLKNAPHATVYGGSVYCNTPYSELNSLDGTKFGKQLEAYLTSTRNGKIAVSLSARTTSEEINQGRVHIAMGFQFDPLLSHRWSYGNLYETIGMLAKIYAKDGSVIARLSSFACCDYDSGIGESWWIVWNPGNADILDTPTRYETQVSLPPGEYNLRVVISDGKRFGRAEVPITIAQRNGKDLEISDLILAKRFREAPTESQASTPKPTGSYVPLISKGIEVTPTANTHFHKESIFYFYFEIYEPPHTEWPKPIVEANLRIVDAKTGKIVKASQPLDAASYVIPGKTVIPIGAGTDISKLSPGAYRLEIQATDSTGQTTPWHSANFTIE